MTGPQESTQARRSELEAGLQRTQQRIVSACQAAGRDRHEVTLIVVTKFFPASDVVALAELGVRDIGESRDQEAKAKVAELQALLPGEHLPRVHFIGQVQTNKAGSVASYANVVHSLDRERLATALDHGCGRAGRRLDVLVQVDCGSGGDSGRGGVAPAELRRLAASVTQRDHLRLRGVMAVAPRDTDPEDAFALLARLAAQVRSDHPQARWISAGMSGDLEAAVRHGATHLRVGTAILGSRPPHG